MPVRSMRTPFRRSWTNIDPTLAQVTTQGVVPEGTTELGHDAVLADVKKLECRLSAKRDDARLTAFDPPT